VVIDNCTPGGDALVKIPGLNDPLAPVPPSGAAAVTNALKCRIAGKTHCAWQAPYCAHQQLFHWQRGLEKRFDDCYDDYRDRVQKV